MYITSLTVEDCVHAAELHQAAFYKGWEKKDFEDFLEDPLVFGLKIQKDELLSSLDSSSLDYHAELVSASDKGSHSKFGMTTKGETTFCGYILWREIGLEAEILTFVVAPPFQRRGVGSLLLNAFFERLNEKGISKTFLEVAEDNNIAKSFYIKHGFTFLGTRLNYYKRPGNQFVDALNFIKVIEG